MVLWALTEFALEAGIWSVGKVYNAGYWMIWGTQKTDAEKLIDQMLKQQETIEQLHGDLQEVSTRLQEIEVREEKIEDKITSLVEHPDVMASPSETHDTSSCTT